MESSTSKNNKRHLVFIRGLVREAEHWGEELVEFLKKGLKADKVSKIDIPGAGIHNDKAVPLSIQGIVKFMREDFLKEHPQGHEAVFITISMGGMIGAEWARLYPEDVKALVLINSSLGGHSPFYRRLKPSAYPMVFAQPFIRDLEKRELSQLKKVSNRPENYPSVVEKWVKIQQERPMTVRSKARQLLAAARYSPSKERPNVPILLLVGLKDRLVAPQCSFDIQKNWDVPLESHPTGGHALGVDAPEWVSEKIINWYQAL